jgi:hypothetical protein
MHTSSRRNFLDQLAIGGLALGGISLGNAVFPDALHAAGLATGQGTWDTRWPKRLTGRVKTIMDVPEIENGYGVWRATVWARQYEQVLGHPAAQLSTALVLRHNAIILAMQQGFWDKYGVGAMKKVIHPVSLQPTDRNPALLTAADGAPEPYASFALPKFMERGGVTLACDLALQFDIIPIIQNADKVSAEVARKQALDWMIPGVILQPSGIFAALLAQQEGALYIRAS